MFGYIDFLFFIFLKFICNHVLIGEKNNMFRVNDMGNSFNFFYN